MPRIKPGDVVGRKSYNKDVLFIVDKILNTTNKTIVILKGVVVRIVADAAIEDLELIKAKLISQTIQNIESEFLSKVKHHNTRLDNQKKEKMCTGKILHVDGDKRYSDKSSAYYKKLNLNAIVKNVPENRQSQLMTNLLEKYNPDILIITGHDAMLKHGTNYNNIYNYRNSKYFINAVKEARKWEPSMNKLIIFARCMSKLF